MPVKAYRSIFLRRGNLKEKTLKLLGVCEAYEELFGIDTYSIKDEITCESGEYDEWQSNLDNP